MLGKLIKHEMKATSRTFAPLVGALAVFTVLTKLLYSGHRYNIMMDNYFTKLVYFLTTLTYGLLIGAAFVMTVVVLLQRFRKNLTGDEGYLMFTLPVHPWQHILAKDIMAAFWLFINGSAAILSIFFLSDVNVIEFAKEIWQGIGMLNQYLGIPTPLLVLEFFLLAVVCLFGFMLSLYLAVAIGQLAKKYKKLAGLGFFLIYQTVTQTIFVQIMGEMQYRWYLKIESIPRVYEQMAPYHARWTQNTILAFLAFVLITGIINFFATQFILSRKLNLE